MHSTTLILCPSLVPLRWCVSSLSNFLSCAPAGYTSSCNFSLNTEGSVNYCFKFCENKMWELLGFTIGIQPFHILTAEVWFRYSLPLEALCHTLVCADYLRTEKKYLQLIDIARKLCLTCINCIKYPFFLPFIIEQWKQQIKNVVLEKHIFNRS